MDASLDERVAVIEGRSLLTVEDAQRLIELTVKENWGDIDEGIVNLSLLGCTVGKIEDLLSNDWFFPEKFARDNANAMLTSGAALWTGGLSFVPIGDEPPDFD